MKLLCGYGPQEGDKTERKEWFWNYLNNEMLRKSYKGNTGIHSRFFLKFVMRYFHW